MSASGVLFTAGGVLLTGVILFRSLSRRRRIDQAHFRGRSLRPISEVVQILSRFRTDAGLLVGAKIFPSEIASRHLAFIGTTGSGKTLLQRLLMQSALSALGKGKRHRAVVYDAKQDTLSILFGMRINAPVNILNPLDMRSVAWDMASDIESPAAAMQVAMTLVPETKGDANPFFTNAARQLFYGTILSLIQLAPRRWTLRQVLLLLRDPERLQGLLARTENTGHLLTYFCHEATAQNIFSTLLTYITPYEIIAACGDRAAKGISLSEWLKTESVLVLGNDEENRAALDVINKLLFRRLAELTLAQPEVENPNENRTWFFLDEVREAGKLDLLGRLLTKGRSKGVAVALGFQDISGMREAYGRESADEILGQCNTKVILRLNSPETASWAAKLFGNREVLESRLGESTSHRLGLKNSEASSGESLSHAITQQALVLDSEIMGLPETSRENGIKALFINPTTGPFEDEIKSEWLDRNLMPANTKVPNFIPRPVSHQYLRPWGIADERLLGPPSSHPEELPPDELELAQHRVGVLRSPLCQ